MVFKLHLTGGYGTTLQFDSVKFVQYPDGSLPTSIPSVHTLSPAQPPPDPKASTDGAELFSEAQSLMSLTTGNAVTHFDSVEGESDVMKTSGTGVRHLWSINYPPVTEGSFAVVGEIRTQDVGDGFLEASSAWTPVGEPDRFTVISTVRTEQSPGPFGRLAGTTSWKAFWLPCGPFAIDPQLAGAPVKLKSLEIDLRLAGTPNAAVYLRNVKLVQCPGGFPKSWTPTGAILPEPQVQYPSPPASLSPSKNSSAMNWKSFILGIVATILTLAAVGSISFWVRRLKKRRHERELRRIASLDG
jgi:hypothetical protein